MDPPVSVPSAPIASPAAIAAAEPPLAAPGAQPCCWPAEQRPSFDYFRDNEQIVRFPRRIRKRLFGSKPVTRNIIAQDVKNRDGMRGGFHLADIYFPKLLYIVKDFSELF